MPSTLIRDSHYDADTQTFSVWLATNGKRYDYLGVPPETHDAYRAAFSKGRFFNRHIRGHFAFHQNGDAETEAAGLVRNR